MDGRPAAVETLERRRLLAADLDPAFGSSGQTYVGAGSSGPDTHVYQAPDGSFYVSAWRSFGAGNAGPAVAHLTPGGALDASFVSRRIGSGNLPTIADLALQSPGHLNVLFSNYQELDRLTSTGDFDTTLAGTGAEAIPGLGASYYPKTIDVLPDGKMLLTGYVRPGSNPWPFVERLNANGTADTTFGASGNGVIELPWPSPYSGTGQGVRGKRLPDGKVLFVGTIGSTSAGQGTGLLRLLPDGTPDASFGTNGRFIDSYNTADVADFAVDPATGAITVLRTSSSGVNLTRYTAAGKYDEFVGFHGSISESDSRVLASNQIEPDARGGYVVRGEAYRTGTSTRVGTLVQLNPNLHEDATFGEQGLMRLDVATTPFAAGDLLVQADGKYAVAGLVGPTTTGQPASVTIVRLRGALPGMSTATFDPNVSPHRVQLAFSEAVTLRPAGGAATLRYLGPNTPADVSASVQLAGDGKSASVSATGGAGALLTDGNYRMTLPAGAVADAAGNPMPVDYSLDFFVLAADANHDRTVDLTDFTVLAANFNGTGKLFSQGDFNYDAKVDLTDFTILASKFNKTLDPPPPAAGIAATASAPAPSARTPTSADALMIMSDATHAVDDLLA